MLETTSCGSKATRHTLFIFTRARGQHVESTVSQGRKVGDEEAKGRKFHSFPVAGMAFPVAGMAFPVAGMTCECALISLHGYELCAG